MWLSVIFTCLSVNVKNDFLVPVSYLWVYPWNIYHTFANFVVHGALRCLALLSGDLDDKVVPTLVPILVPSMLTIVSSPQVCFNLIFSVNWTFQAIFLQWIFGFCFLKRWSHLIMKVNFYECVLCSCILWYGSVWAFTLLLIN